MARKTQRAWRITLVRLAHTYLLVGTAMTLAAFTVFDWVTNRNFLPADEIKISTTSTLTVDSAPWNFFHPVWQDDSEWNFLPPVENNFDVFYRSASDAGRYVQDPHGRTEKEFKVPESLRKRVTFWMEIYSHYSSRTRVVHDRNDPGKVYGYIDFRPLYRLMGAGSATETKVANLEAKILKELKARLSEAAGITKTTILEAEEKATILKMLSMGGASTKETARDAIEAIRTQTGQSDMFLAALYRSRNLLPHIESVFKRQGLPAGLSRIPFVESSFNVNARSSVGAVGIWQFMPETARELIHSEEEMWSDPLRQTKSAARMLKMYKTVLPDWSTTITSYNSGVGRVRRIVEKHRMKNAEGFPSMASDEGLGFAGKNFYSEFLAANLVEAYKEELFSRWLGPNDFSMIFSGSVPFPKDICSAL